MILHDAGKHDEAISLVQKSLEVEPKIAIFHRNMGAVYRGADRYEDAVVSLRKALELAPDDGLCWSDFGVSLDKAGCMVDALAAYEKAIRLLTPVVDASQRELPAEGLPKEGLPIMELARSHYNAGSVWGRLGKPAVAMKEYEAAISVVPNFGEPHRNRAAILFQTGDLAQAFAEYEWRWKCGDYPGKYPSFSQPTWNGQDLDGKTILIWWEQGFGDTIMFCRYAPLIAARGGKVVLLCQKELKRLLKTLDGLSDLAYNGERKIHFDTHASLMSIPHLMGTSLETIPAPRCYLKADPDDSAEWEAPLGRRRPRISGRPGLGGRGGPQKRPPALRPPFAMASDSVHGRREVLQPATGRSGQTDRRASAPNARPRSHRQSH